MFILQCPFTNIVGNIYPRTVETYKLFNFYFAFLYIMLCITLYRILIMDKKNSRLRKMLLYFLIYFVFFPIVMSNNYKSHIHTR